MTYRKSDTYAKHVNLKNLMKHLNTEGLTFDALTLERHVEAALMMVADRQRRLQASRPKFYANLSEASRNMRSLLKDAGTFVFKGDKWYVTAGARAMRGWREVVYNPKTAQGIPESLAVQAGVFIDGMKDFPGDRIYLPDFLKKLPKRLPPLNGGCKYCMFQGFQEKDLVRFERTAKPKFFVTKELLDNLFLFDNSTSIFLVEIGNALLFHDPYRFVVVRTHDAATF